MVKNLSAVQGTWVWSPGWDDPLEKQMATHSSILDQKIPWIEEPGRLQSMGSWGVRYFLATKSPPQGYIVQQEKYNQYFIIAVNYKVKATQLCLALCNPKDYIVHGIFQARILEWVAFPFSRGSFQPRDWTQVSHFAGRFFTSWDTRKAHKWALLMEYNLLKIVNHYTAYLQLM